MKLVRGSLLVLAALASLSALPLAGCSNDDGGPAAPVAKELNSGDIAPGGGTFAHPFPATITAVTTFPYHCTRHPSMNGVVTVDPASPNATAAVPINATADFPPVTVQPGGTVTWTNNDGTAHTVTSD